MEFDEEEIIELSEEEVFDDEEDEDDDDDDEWVEETHHSERNASRSANQQDDNLDVLEDDEVEEEEFVDEEYDEEVEEVWDEDDALSDEQFLNQLHKSFQEMAKKQNHHSSTRSNSLASIKEEETAFPTDGNGSDNTGSFSVDESASVDFDLGSYQDNMSESSQEEPLDYEQACRNLIAMVYQEESVDADDIIRRCDLKNLYKNLKQQHKHLVKSKSQMDVDNSPWESFNQAATGFASIPTAAEIGEPTEDWMFDDGNDPWGFKNIQNPAPHVDGAAFHEANRLPKAGLPTELPQVVSEPILQEDKLIPQNTTKPESNDRPVEKWLERDADDPDDYEYACRTLIAILYKDDDDHDPDTMLRRSQPKDLYRYLKNEYWFLEHTGLIHEKLATKGVATVAEEAPRLQDMIRSIKRESTMQLTDISTERGEEKLSDGFEATEIVDILNANGGAASPSNETKVLMNPGPKVEKWLERNADDPEDFEVACRKLALILYRDDEDYDVNTMLRRTSPEDLYRYLSNEYWYEVRKGNLVGVDLDSIQLETNINPQDKSTETLSALERQLSARIPKNTTEIEHQYYPQLLVESKTEKAGDRPSVVSSNNSDDVPYVRCGSSESVEGLDEKGVRSPQSSAQEIAWPAEMPEDSEHHLSQQAASWNTLDLGTTNDDSSVESIGVNQQSWDTRELPLGDSASVREVTRSLLDPSMSNHDSVEPSIDEDAESLSDDVVPSDNKAVIMNYGESEAIINQNSDDSRGEMSENHSKWEVLGEGIVSSDSVAQNDYLGSPIQKKIKTVPINLTTHVYDLDLAKRLEVIEEEMLLLIRQAEIEELDESFEQAAVNTLVLAAQKLAYRKKYYDVFSDRFVFFPPIAKTIMDYSLFDMIEEQTRDELDCFPDIYSSSLRSIANKHLAILHLDFDYMDKLGIQIEDMMGERLGDQEDKINSVSIDYESNSQQRASSTTSHYDSAVFEEDNPRAQFIHDDESNDSQLESGDAPVRSDIEAREVEHRMSTDWTDEGPSSFEKTIDKAENSDDNVRELGTQRSPDGMYPTTKHDSSSTRFREMSQILEFKRRIDKARLSEEADSLQKMRIDSETFLQEGRARLEEERNVALQEIEDTAKLLETKHKGDAEDIRRKLDELKATRKAAEQEITIRLQELEEKRRNFVAQQAGAIEAQRLSQQIALSQKQEEVLKRLLTAQLALETEREAAEEALLESTADDQGKAVGLFGVFGQRKRNLELEKQKQRQTNLMQWKLREMELEKEIKDAKHEQDIIVEQLNQLELGSKELDFKLEERNKSLEQEMLSEENKLRDLSIDNERKFVEGETKLLALKRDIELLYAQDIAWVADERNVIESKYNEGLLQLAEAEKRERERLIQAENMLNASALALKEKWVREEKELSENSRHADTFDPTLEYLPSSVEGHPDKIQFFPENENYEGKKNEESDEVAGHRTDDIQSRKVADTRAKPGVKSYDDEIQLECTTGEQVPIENAKGASEETVDAGLPDNVNQVEEVKADTGYVEQEGLEDVFLKVGYEYLESKETVPQARTSELESLGLQGKGETGVSKQDEEPLGVEDVMTPPVQGWQIIAPIPINVERINCNGTHFRSHSQTDQGHDDDSDDAQVTKGEDTREIATCDPFGDHQTKELMVISTVEVEQLEGLVSAAKMKSTENDLNNHCEASRSSTLAKEHNHHEEPVSAQIEAVTKATDVDGHHVMAVDEEQCGEREVTWEGVKNQPRDTPAENEKSSQAQTELVFERISSTSACDWDPLPVAQVDSEHESTQSYDPIDDNDGNEGLISASTTTNSPKEIVFDESATEHITQRTTDEESGVYNDGSLTESVEVPNANATQNVTRMSEVTPKMEQLEDNHVDSAGSATAGDFDTSSCVGEESGSQSSNSQNIFDVDNQNLVVTNDSGEQKQLEESETPEKTLQGAGPNDFDSYAHGQQFDLDKVKRVKNLDDDSNDVVASLVSHQLQPGETWENQCEVQHDIPQTGQNHFDVGDGGWATDVSMPGETGGPTDDLASQVQEQPTTSTFFDLVKHVESEAGDICKINDGGIVIPPCRAPEELESHNSPILDGFLAHEKTVETEASDEMRTVADADGYNCHDQDMDGPEVEDRPVEAAQMELQAGHIPLPVVDVPFASFGVTASSRMDENSFRSGTLTQGQHDTLKLPEGEKGNEAFGSIQNPPTFTEIQHQSPSETENLSSSASSFSAPRVSSGVSPKSAHFLDSPLSKRYLGATHKRKHKPGGGLAGRLLEEAQHFLESSTGSFSQVVGTSEPGDKKLLDRLNDTIEDEGGYSQASPSSPATSPSIQKALVLLSRTATTRAQETEQDRALVILKTLGIDVEIVDGSDLSQKALRDSLFEHSRLRGIYPQIFVQTKNGENVFFGDFAELECANETGQLSRRLEQCSTNVRSNFQLALDGPRDAMQQTINNPSPSLVSRQAEAEENCNNDGHDCEQSLHLLQPLVVGYENPAVVMKGSDSSIIDVSMNGSRSANTVEPEDAEGGDNPNLVQVATTESLFRDSWPVTRLQWWRENGKSLVEQKLKASTSAPGVNADGSHPSMTSSSLIEKRRLIAERRQRALAARAQIASASIGGYQHESHDSGGSSGRKDEETQENLHEVGVDEEARMRHADANIPRSPAQRKSTLGPTQVLPEIKDTADNRSAENDMLPNGRLQSGRYSQIENKSLDTIRKSVNNSSLDEKRRRAAEARARAMAARNSPRPSSFLASMGTRMDKSDGQVEGSTAAELSSSPTPSSRDHSGMDVKRAERMAEARRLSLNSARAREARLAREAQLLARTEQAAMMKANEQRQEENIDRNASESLGASVLPLTTEVTSRDVSKSSVMPQMIREADRLTSFIVRYEKKLETVCRSLLALAQQHEGDEEAENIQKSTLPEMYSFLIKRDWFQRHSTNEEAPRLFLATSHGHVESFEQPSEMYVDSCLQLTPLGSAYLAMDDLQQSEFGRFLLSIQGSKRTINELRQHWADVAHSKPGDSLAQSIEGRLERLVTFGLDARLITVKES